MNQQEYNEAREKLTAEELLAKEKMESDPRYVAAGKLYKEAEEAFNQLHRELYEEYGLNEIVSRQYDLLDQMPMKEEHHCEHHSKYHSTCYDCNPSNVDEDAREG